jgi:hypothetical protein
VTLKSPESEKRGRQKDTIEVFLLQPQHLPDVRCIFMLPRSDNSRRTLRSRQPSLSAKDLTQEAPCRLAYEWQGWGQRRNPFESSHEFLSANNPCTTKNIETEFHVLTVSHKAQWKEHKSRGLLIPQVLAASRCFWSDRYRTSIRPQFRIFRLCSCIEVKLTTVQHQVLDITKPQQRYQQFHESSKTPVWYLPWQTSSSTNDYSHAGRASCEISA